MIVGTEKIKRLIMNKLDVYHAVLRGGGYGKFASELTEEIYELIGDDMNSEWGLAHNFPPELEKVAKKLESGLNINLMRNEKAIEVYSWILEQEKIGKPISKFIEWAMNDEQAKFVSKYRFNPGLIQNDYRFAFENKNENNPLGLEINF